MLAELCWSTLPSGTTTAQCTYVNGILHVEQLASAADRTLSGEGLTDLTVLQCTCTVMYCTVLLGMHERRWVVSYLRSGYLFFAVLLTTTIFVATFDSGRFSSGAAWCGVPQVPYMQLACFVLGDSRLSLGRVCN